MRPVILDVDTGIDDALAICYALRSPELEVVGITTSFGNAGLAATTRNTLQVVELCGRPDIPVYAGAGRALLRPQTADFEEGAAVVHGTDGLGDIGLPTPAGSAEPGHAADFLLETARSRPGEVTLITLGPLTNLALAIRLEPEVAKRFARVVIMGGAVTVPGNVTPTAEANIWVDPEAAQIVLRSGADVCLVGLDVTMQMLLTPGDLERLSQAPDPAARALAEATRCYLRGYQTLYPGIGGCGMHDPLAVAVAADPGQVRTERFSVDVECRGALTRGQTVADRRGVAGVRPNAEVCLEVDAPRFMKRLLERLGA